MPEAPKREDEGVTKGAGVLILGIGNRLLMDEGVGSCFAEALSTFELPGIDVVDGGLGGINLLDYMDGRKVMFIVDALDRAEGDPGTVKLFRVNSRAVRPSEAIRMLLEAGSHGVVPEILIAAADAMGYLPGESYILGIIPCLIDLGDGITSTVVRGCIKALELLKVRLSKYGLRINIDPNRFKERLLDICPEVHAEVLSCTSGL